MSSHNMNSNQCSHVFNMGRIAEPKQKQQIRKICHLFGSSTRQLPQTQHSLPATCVVFIASFYCPCIKVYCWYACLETAWGSVSVCTIAHGAYDDVQNMMIWTLRLRLLWVGNACEHASHGRRRRSGTKAPPTTASSLPTCHQPEACPRKGSPDANEAHLGRYDLEGIKRASTPTWSYEVNPQGSRFRERCGEAYI